MVSRIAQVVALGIFGLPNSEVVFRTPSRISKIAALGLLDLVDAGMIVKIPKGKLPVGAIGYKSTKKMGFPMRDFKAIDPNNPDEMFPLLIQEPK